MYQLKNDTSPCLCLLANNIAEITVLLILLVLQLHHVCNCNTNESLLLTPFQEQYYIQ